MYLGRSTVRETDLYSTCCAIQNLWLAARAEGIGVGWVSIVDHGALKQVLGIPRPVKVLAYLCLGYVADFATQPDWRRQDGEPGFRLTNSFTTNRGETPVAG